MKKYIGILLVFIFSLLSAPVIADSTNIAGDAAATVKAVNSTVETVATNVEGVNKNLVFVSDKIESALTQLSTKLGVAAEKVWGILVKQALVESYTYMYMLILCFLYIYIVYRIHIKWATKDKYGNTPYDELEGIVIVPMVVMAIIAVIWVIGSLINIPNMITGFVNPEYSALKQVLNAL